MSIQVDEQILVMAYLHIWNLSLNSSNFAKLESTKSPRQMSLSSSVMSRNLHKSIKKDSGDVRMLIPEHVEFLRRYSLANMVDDDGLHLRLVHTQVFCPDSANKTAPGNFSCRGACLPAINRDSNEMSHVQCTDCKFIFGRIAVPRANLRWNATLGRENIDDRLLADVFHYRRTLLG